MGVLICESWPSWFFTFETLSIECSFIFIDDYPNDWIEILVAQYPSVKVCAFHEFDSMLPLILHPEAVLFAQGSACWLTSTTASMIKFSRVIASVSYGSFPSTNHSDMWFCQSVDSVSTGSLIQGSWDFALKGFNERFCIPRLYERQLKHIIDVTNGRFRSRVLNTSSRSGTHPYSIQQTVNWDEQLPKAQPLTKVRCKSVFVKHGWVERQLTAVELARAFDVPGSLHESFKTWSIVQLPWLTTAPVKTLLQTGVSILGGLSFGK